VLLYHVCNFRFIAFVFCGCMIVKVEYFLVIIISHSALYTAINCYWSNLGLILFEIEN